MNELSIPGGFLSSWCDANAAGGEHPAGAYLGTGLVMMSTVLAPLLRIYWSPTHEEMANLWVVGTGDSGAGKTTIGSSLGYGVSCAEAVIGDQVRALQVSRVSAASLVADLDVMGPLIERAEKIERAKAKEEGRDPDPVVVDEPEPCVSHVLRLNELGMLWGASPSDRTGNQAWVEEARQVLLSVFDGKLSSHTRATKVLDQKCCVSAIGNIPTSELRDRTTLQTISSGFAGRWAVLPMPARDRLVATPKRNGKDPRLVIAGAVGQVCNLFRDSETVYINDKIEDAALEARQEWYERGLGELAGALDEQGLAHESLFQRMQSTALKLAAYCQISRDLGRPAKERLFDLEELRIDRVSILWGQVIVDQAITRMHDMATSNTPSRGRVDSSDEERVYEWLVGRGYTHEESQVTQRELKKSLFTAKAMSARGLTDGHVQAMLKNMAAMGAIVATPGNRGSVNIYAVVE